MDLAIFGLAVAVLLVLGIVVGILIAPRLSRWADGDDDPEEPE